MNDCRNRDSSVMMSSVMPSLKYCSGSPLKLVNDNTAIDDSEAPTLPAFLLHEPAVADHIGGKDRRQAALGAPFDYGVQ